MSRKQLEIDETRERVYHRDGHKCQYPGCDVAGYMNLQLAHKIRQGQENSIMVHWKKEFKRFISKKDANEILHNDLNLVSMCSVHNSSVDITFNPEERRKLLKKIYKNIE
jgi:5-methylcytosine-specific restriction endonuclease McrA